MKKFLLTIAFVLVATCAWADRAQYVPDLVMTSPSAVWTDVRAYTGATQLVDAITAINATDGTLLITENVTLSANDTVEAGVTLKFVNDAKIDLNGKVLTINGYIDAPPVQIFDITDGGSSVVRGASTASCNINDKVYAEWWGAVGNGSTNDAPKLNAAFAFGKSVCVELLAKAYYIESTVSMSDGSTLRGASGTRGFGSGVNVSKIVSKVNVTPAVLVPAVGGGAHESGVHIDGVTIHREDVLYLVNPLDEVGLEIESSQNFVVENCQIYGYGTGIVVGESGKGCWGGTIDRCLINWIAGYFIHIIDSMNINVTNTSLGMNGGHDYPSTTTGYIAIEGTSDTCRFDSLQLNATGIGGTVTDCFVFLNADDDNDGPWFFSNIWAENWTNAVFRFDSGTETIDHLNVSNCYFSHGTPASAKIVDFDSVSGDAKIYNSIFTGSTLIGDTTLIVDNLTLVGNFIQSNLTLEDGAVTAGNHATIVGNILIGTLTVNDTVSATITGNTIDHATSTIVFNSTGIVNIVGNSYTNYPAGSPNRIYGDTHITGAIKYQSDIDIVSGATNITAAQTCTTFWTSAATAFELPADPTGLIYSFVVGHASNVTINPDGTDIILYAGCAAGDKLLSATVGDTITLYGYSTTTWAVMSVAPGDGDFTDTIWTDND